MNIYDILNQINILIAGITGSGKSVLLNALIYGAMQESPENCRMFLIDNTGRGGALAKFATIPHVVDNTVFCNPAEIFDILKQILSIVEYRQNNIDPWAEKSAGFPVYVFIDEFSNIRSSYSSKEQKEFDRVLKMICNQCRKTNVHIIVATQEPSKKGIPAEIINNFTCKIALRCNDSIQSRHILGVPGAEMLPEHGYALIATNGKNPVKICVPYYDTEFLKRAVYGWDEYETPDFPELDAVRDTVPTLEIPEYIPVEHTPHARATATHTESEFIATCDSVDTPTHAETTAPSYTGFAGLAEMIVKFYHIIINLLLTGYETVSAYFSTLTFTGKKKILVCIFETVIELSLLAPAITLKIFCFLTWHITNIIIVLLKLLIKIVSWFAEDFYFRVFTCAILYCIVSHM